MNWRKQEVKKQSSFGTSLDSKSQILFHVEKLEKNGWILSIFFQLCPLVFNLSGHIMKTMSLTKLKLLPLDRKFHFLQFLFSSLLPLDADFTQKWHSLLEKSQKKKRFFHRIQESLGCNSFFFMRQRSAFCSIRFAVR